MNIVHELGPNGDSETILSRKPGRKPSRVHEHPTGSTGPACAHRPRLAVSQPQLSCRSVHAACPRVPSRATGPSAPACAVSWPCSALYCDTVPSWPPLSSHDTIRPSQAKPHPQSRYSLVYRNTAPQPCKPPLSRYNIIVL